MTCTLMEGNFLNIYILVVIKIVPSQTCLTMPVLSFFNALDVSGLFSRIFTYSILSCFTWISECQDHKTS